MSRMKKGNSYRSGEKALTPKQVDILLSKVDNLVHKGLLELAITGGLRRDDVIHVEQANVKDSEFTVTFYECKKRRIKVVSIPVNVMSTLMQIKNIYKGYKYMFPGRSEGKGKNGHISSKQAYNVFQKYLERTGLGNRPFHALRATCIKLCQFKGWAPEQTAEHVGDKISTIQEHYLTPSTEEMRAVAQEKRLL